MVMKWIAFVCTKPLSDISVATNAQVLVKNKLNTILYDVGMLVLFIQIRI